MVRQNILHGIFWASVAIIGVGVILGAIFPAGTDPFVPRASAVVVKGRNLCGMIAQNNMRHRVGEPWCDPKTCSNSIEFITGVLNVIGGGCPYGSHTNVGVNLWNVAIDVPDDCDDSVPILLSANFNPRFLECRSDDDRILPLGRKASAQREPFDNKGIVVVRKGGGALIFKAKRCTRKSILCDSLEQKYRITYLTPNGRTTVDIGCTNRLDAVGGPHGH